MPCSTMYGTSPGMLKQPGVMWMAQGWSRWGWRPGKRREKPLVSVLRVLKTPRTRNPRGWKLHQEVVVGGTQLRKPPAGDTGEWGCHVRTLRVTVPRVYPEAQLAPSTEFQSASPRWGGDLGNVSRWLSVDPGRDMVSCPRYVSVSVEPVQVEDR